MTNNENSMQSNLRDLVAKLKAKRVPPLPEEMASLAAGRRCGIIQRKRGKAFKVLLFEDWILSQVIIVNDCWEWQGNRMWLGYGDFVFKGKHVRAHRAFYGYYVGPIPDGMMVCHKCDNRPCCNPDHLYLGTHKDNMRDMIEKGRGNMLPGERNQNAKLKNAYIPEIRKLYGEGWSQREITEKYSVAQTTIGRALRGVSYSKIL